jgi:3-oxoacyl-[acyl-carrier protein] reductase
MPIVHVHLGGATIGVSKAPTLEAAEGRRMSKTIVITGAGGGLGRALARRFAAEGETVILLGRTAAKVEALAQEIGAPALAIECDVAQPGQVRSAFAAIAAQHPKIDVLINNAAIFNPSLIAEASDELIVQTININLTGAILCARAAIPMLEAGGQIINVTSESIDMVFPHLALYQSSKAGLEQFSRSLCHELEPAGVRVTTIRAGTMSDGLGQENINGLGGNPDSIARFFQACLAVGLNLMQRPVSKFQSVTDIFRAVIDLPPDFHVERVDARARKATP